MKTCTRGCPICREIAARIALGTDSVVREGGRFYPARYMETAKKVPYVRRYRRRDDGTTERIA